MQSSLNSKVVQYGDATSTKFHVGSDPSFVAMPGCESDRSDRKYPSRCIAYSVSIALEIRLLYQIQNTVQ